MTDFIDISFLGEQRLQRQLRALDIKLQRKIVRGAMRKAMRPVLKAARNKVPFDQGWLKSSLHIKSRTRKGVTKLYVATGTREKLQIDADEKAFYPAVLEFGTFENRAIAKPYLRPAITENKTQVIEIMRKDIAKGIERGLRR
jgi:HK97 gp10 family phage protein